MALCDVFVRGLSRQVKDTLLALAIRTDRRLWIHAQEGRCQLTVMERQAMKDYISKALVDGLIRPSSSPACAGGFFVDKKDGSLRPCIDYRRIECHHYSGLLSTSPSFVGI